MAARCVGLGRRTWGARSCQVNAARGNVREVSSGSPKDQGIVAPPYLLLFPKLHGHGILAGNLTRALLNTSEASGWSIGERVWRLPSPCFPVHRQRGACIEILPGCHLNGYSNYYSCPGLTSFECVTSAVCRHPYGVEAIHSFTAFG